MMLTRFALDKTRITLIVALSLAIGGLVSFTSLPREEDPPYTVRTATVTTRFPGADAQRIEELRKHAPHKLADPVVRSRLAEVKMELQRHRALAIRNAVTIASGEIKPGEASMAKISGSELRYRMTNLMLDILGRVGSLERDDERAVDDALIQGNYLNSPIMRFGGGTNEVQRSILAARHLGMTR